MRTSLAATLVAAGGCDDGSKMNVGDDAAVIDTVDAPVWNGPCWPSDTATPGGSITLGSGPQGEFQPMPSELQLVYGGQDGFNLVVNVKQMGFGTGDPADILNVTNPRTRIHAFFADTDVPLMANAECPFRFGYQDIGGGEYVSVDVVSVIFDTCWRSGNLIGKQIRIEAEILDWNGTTYAMDSRTVTATAPQPGYPDEPNAPGCPP
jgi:hypothetical protein